MEFLPKKNRDRSRVVFLALGIFVVLDLSVLAASYWLSYQLAEDAVTINLAGRQRMLSQRMVKALLHLEQAPDQDQRIAALAELRLTFEMFDSTLRALHRGGIATAGDGKQIRIHAIGTAPAQTLIHEAEQIWQPYREKVSALLQGPEYMTQDRIAAAVAEAKAHNLALLDRMNSLTTTLEESAVDKTTRIRLLQAVTFTLAILSFMQIILMLRRELNKASKHQDTLNSIIHKINAGILVSGEDGRIRAANHSAGTLFGYDALDMIDSAHGKLLFLRDGALYGRRRDGSIFHAESHCRELLLDDTTVRLETIADISQQRSLEKTLSHLAYHDALTGLPNRLLFDDRLQQGILSAKRHNRKLAVLFVDLNKFKQVNDTYGHHTGDLLLKEIAVRLRNVLREEDTISRFGGDEFGILLTSVSDPADCELIIGNLLTTLRAPFVTESITLTPDASIGISLYPEDGNEEKILVRRADMAMYQAKRANSHRYAFYTPPDLSRISDT